MTQAKKLINDCLIELDQKYGSNSKHFLPYHNAEHAHDVMDAAVLIGKEQKLDSHTIELLELAACFHDIEHGIGRGEDEKASARIASERMTSIGYSTEDAHRVTEMILATTVDFRDGAINQSATDDITTQIIADADLASFGRPFATFWDRSLKLRQENGHTSELVGQEKQDFLRSQISVLEKHSFYTEAAAQIFSHTAENIIALRALLETT
ncbi:MAG: hypothetical protein U0491_01050 [Candidatus Saccharimonadales bacterium]